MATVTIIDPRLQQRKEVRHEDYFFFKRETTFTDYWVMSVCMHVLLYC